MNTYKRKKLNLMKYSKNYQNSDKTKELKQLSISILAQKEI